MDEINQEDVQVLVAALAKRMRSHSVKNVLGTLSSIMKTARAWGYSAGRWRLEDLILPRDHEPRRDRSFTVDEVSRILLRAAQPWKALFALAAFAALRGGEILGLTVDDIDLMGGVVHVRRSVSPSRALQSPKTRGSDRTIPMAPPLQAIIEEHLRNTWTPNPSGLLFATRTGRLLSHTKVLEKRLWPLLEALKIERRGLHSFRHTATSLLIEASVPLPVVREIVGHASVATTLGIYAHVVRAEHRDAMEKLGQILLPDVTGFEGKPLQVN